MEQEKGFIPVVIPYLASESQGRELELAVLGWRAHFLTPHKVFIVGDRNPVVEKGWPDVEFVECPRIQPVEGQYLPHLDIVNKFFAFRERCPEAPGFIYACDDMYAVKYFTIHDVAQPKLSEWDIPSFDWRKEGGWLGDLGKTRELCIRHGYPTANWVCHLPVAYAADLFDMMEDWNGRKESFVWENIYFNKHHGVDFLQAVHVPPTGSRWKYEVKTSSPGISSTDEANAIWITNANCGWSRRLEDILLEHYRKILPLDG